MGPIMTTSLKPSVDYGTMLPWVKCAKLQWKYQNAHWRWRRNIPAPA